MPGQGNPLLCVVALYVGEGSEKEQCHLLGSRPTFCHFPHFPQADCTLSGADSRVGGFVYILGLSGSLQQILLWGWEFLPLLKSPQIFIARGSEAFLCWNPGLCGLSPQFFLLVYPHANVGSPTPPATTWLCILSTLASHLHPSY